MHVLLLPMTHAHAQLWLPRFMEASHRRPLIAQEVLGYNADVVCLQEVDEKAFHTYFNPCDAARRCAGISVVAFQHAVNSCQAGQQVGCIELCTCQSNT